MKDKPRAGSVVEPGAVRDTRIARVSPLTTPADSQANFCWFDLPEEADEATVVKGLAERGVLVRAGTALGREKVVAVNPPGRMMLAVTPVSRKSCAQHKVIASSAALDGP